MAASAQESRRTMHARWMTCLALALGVAGCKSTVPTVTATTSAAPPIHEDPRTSSGPVVVPAGVRAKLIGQEGASRTYQLVLAPGTEAVQAISEFVTSNQIQAAHFEGLGACTDAVVAYYDPTTHAYQKTAYQQQMEIVSIIGDAAPTAGDGAGFHAHIGLAFADGTMHGGHLVEVHVSPTMELTLTASPTPVHRAYDETLKAWLLVP